MFRRLIGSIVHVFVLRTYIVTTNIQYNTLNHDLSQPFTLDAAKYADLFVWFVIFVCKFCIFLNIYRKVSVIYRTKSLNYAYLFYYLSTIYIFHWGCLTFMFGFLYPPVFSHPIIYRRRRFYKFTTLKFLVISLLLSTNQNITFHASQLIASYGPNFAVSFLIDCSLCSKFCRSYLIATINH